ncbi:IS200/IS605 family transposase [Crocinitomix catalasitica]|uniref:IS200/IS605 family transposase n=1 Tax=Crocinitomix catalasitica TaxID=184607 RepID=UPI0004833190|nr:IS200/IS605 family transposase [Crocinitomix catalasitica]
MAAGTFSQIYIQVVIVVKRRQKLIHSLWEDDLYKYITGIVQGKGQKIMAINGMPDHVHILIGIKPTCLISDLVREVKKASNVFVNRNNYLDKKFSWQGGYGVFSYSTSAIPNVIRYILNQKEHHQKQTFTAEYKTLLEHFQVVYKDEYLFDDITLLEE